jgi:N6-L-threonylcarbamoyladenine synthase
MFRPVAPGTDRNGALRKSPSLSLMLILGIETSCDETGVALYDSHCGLLSHSLHSQATMHAAYGGVVPELASRDHIRHLLPLIQDAVHTAHRQLQAIDVIAYTVGPGLAGALLAGAGVAQALAWALGIPVLPVHHLEAHLLSPRLAPDPPDFPFVALLVSGGHTQLMDVTGVGRYTLLGDTLDDAAGEAFDKAAKLLGLPYPGGPALAELADQAAIRVQPGTNHEKDTLELPRPMIASGDLNFSFSGLKTALLTALNNYPPPLTTAQRIALAQAFQEAATEVLATKAMAALAQCKRERLVVAGGVGANHRLRERLHHAAHRDSTRVYYPPVELCTDNGAMIAFCAAQRLMSGVDHARPPGSFAVHPRMPLL